MLIQRGAQQGAQKVVIYGPEGIGKTTVAAMFPKAVIVDVERGSLRYDVARTLPASWDELLDHIEQLAFEPECGSVIVDTADKAEQMCVDHVCARNGWDGIESPGFGRGYVALAKEWQKMLDALDAAVGNGRHAVVCAHAAMRKFEQPDEAGSYDRWELKLNKKTAPLLKEWSDALLFANYKTIVEAVGEGTAKRNKARGGKRVMYVSHHACWDAKNRWGIEEEHVPFSFESIERFVAEGGCADTGRTAGADNAVFTLMERDGITAETVEAVSAESGNTESGTKIKDYTQEYIEWLEANWDEFAGKCREHETYTPF